MSKMTDKEIIKALKHCYEHKSCNDCVGSLGAEECILNVDPAGYIYPIINRQQAEIERLKEEVALKSLKCNLLEQEKAKNISVFVDDLKLVRADAIKEFAENLKYKLKGDNVCDFLFVRMAINNLVKEMVGEGK